MTCDIILEGKNNVKERTRVSVVHMNWSVITKKKLFGFVI